MAMAPTVLGYRECLALACWAWAPGPSTVELGGLTPPVGKPSSAPQCWASSALLAQYCLGAYPGSTQRPRLHGCGLAWHG